MSDGKEEVRETDQLKYQGSRFPFLLVVAWALLIVFVFVYLGRYMWPDLMVWLNPKS